MGIFMLLFFCYKIKSLQLSGSKQCRQEIRMFIVQRSRRGFTGSPALNLPRLNSRCHPELCDLIFCQGHLLLAAFNSLDIQDWSLQQVASRESWQPLRIILSTRGRNRFPTLRFVTIVLLLRFLLFSTLILVRGGMGIILIKLLQKTVLLPGHLAVFQI